MEMFINDQQKIFESLSKYIKRKIEKDKEFRRAIVFGMIDGARSGQLDKILYSSSSPLYSSSFPLADRIRDYVDKLKKIVGNVEELEKMVGDVLEEEVRDRLCVDTLDEVFLRSMSEIKRDEEIMVGVRKLRRLLTFKPHSLAARTCHSLP